MKHSLPAVALGVFLSACSSPNKPADDSLVPLPTGTRIVLPRGHDPGALRVLSGEPTNRTGRVVELYRDAHLYFGPIQ